MLLSSCRSVASVLLTLLIGVLPVFPIYAQELVDVVSPVEGSQEWVVFAGEAGAPLTVQELEWIEMPSIREQFLTTLPVLSGTVLAEDEDLYFARSVVESGVFDSFSYGVLVGDSAQGYVVVMVFQDDGFRAARLVYTSNNLEDAVSAANLLASHARGEQPAPFSLPVFTPECPCESSCQATLQADETACADLNLNCVGAALAVLGTCLTVCALLGGNPVCLGSCIAIHAIQLLKCDADLRACQRSALARFKICLTTCDGDPGPPPDPFVGN